MHFSKIFFTSNYHREHQVTYKMNEEIREKLRNGCATHIAEVQNM